MWIFFGSRIRSSPIAAPSRICTPGSGARTNPGTKPGPRRLAGSGTLVIVKKWSHRYESNVDIADTNGEGLPRLSDFYFRPARDAGRSLRLVGGNALEGVAELDKTVITLREL